MIALTDKEKIAQHEIKKLVRYVSKSKDEDIIRFLSAIWDGASWEDIRCGISQEEFLHYGVRQLINLKRFI